MESINRLNDQLKMAGFEKDLSSLLAYCIQTGDDHFDITYYKEYDNDKVRYDLQFELKAEKEYAFTGYQAQLFHHLEIDHATIEGIDSRELDKQMRNADWYYDYTEDFRVWRKGEYEMEQINSGLKRLCGDEKGALIATQLWNNHVPLYSVAKPEFIQSGETKFGLYPIKHFSPEVRAENAYNYLKNISTSLNHTIMNEKNLEALQKNLKYAGFGESLNEQLAEKIKSGTPEFTLNHSAEYGNRKMEGTLYFRKGEENDIYFFNKYDAKLTRGDGREREQTFYSNIVKVENEATKKTEYKSNSITFKEAFNLLDGRSVNKDFTKNTGEQYNAWIKLDFTAKNDSGNHEMKRYHENFGYDVAAAVDKLPLKFDGDKERDELLRSLKKGNLQIATNNEGERVYVAADPESGKTNKAIVLDKNFKEITTEMRNVGQSSAPQPGNEQEKKSEKSAGEEVEEKEKKTKVNKGKGGSEDGDDLLPKKSAKKGRQKANAGGGDGDLITQNDTGRSQGKRR